MIKKIPDWGYIVILLLFVIAFNTRWVDKDLINIPNQPIPLVEVQTFPLGKGWGYRILVSGKKFIQQEYIPALPGKQPFHSRDSAKVVGEWIGKQVEEGKNPSISMKVLDSLFNVNSL